MGMNDIENFTHNRECNAKVCICVCVLVHDNNIMQNVAQFASIVLALEYNITSHHNQDNYLADPEACHVH